MPAYILVQAEIHDWDAYREYMLRSPRAIARYGGHFIVRGGDRVTLEGEAGNERVAILEFPTLADAQAFYHSPEYAAAKRFREGAATVRFTALDGYPSSVWLEAVTQSEAVVRRDAEAGAPHKPGGTTQE